MKLVVKIGLIAMLFASFIGVRALQNHLFYDPLIPFFKGDFKSNSLPEFRVGLYILSIAFRYILNAAIGLAIIYVAFKSINHLKFAAFVLTLALTILLILLSYSLFWEQENHTLLIYVRRILMHPILLFVLLPALYFQDQIQKKKSD